MTPQERQLRSRIGGFSLAAQRDPKEYTKAGREAFMQSFEDAVDPEGILPEEERQRRAEAARKAYFAQLALKSSKARKKTRATQGHPPV